MQNLKRINFSGCFFTKNSLQQLSTLSKLERIDFSNCIDISDKDMMYISELMRLNYIHLSYNISDVGASYMSGLTKLKEMNVRGHLTNDGIEYFSDMKIMKNMTISGGLFDHISSLCGLTKIQYLDLGYSKNLLEFGMKEISRLNNLKTLILKSCVFYGEGLQYLSSLAHIQNLDLSFCKNISNEGIKYISELTSLQSINLKKTNISNLALQYLSGLINLHELNLKFCPISLPGIKYLTSLVNLKTLNLGYCNKIHNSKEVKDLLSCLNITSLKTRKYGLPEKRLPVYEDSS